MDRQEGRLNTLMLSPIAIHTEANIYIYIYIQNAPRALGSDPGPISIMAEHMGIEDSRASTGQSIGNR